MKAPGKATRNGISIMELANMFPDEDAARKWWESVVWPSGRFCPRCGSQRTHECKHKWSPYRCTDCRKYFSAKTGTLIEGSNVPFRKWAFAIYLECTSLKGISSMKLHRDIDVCQKTAWFMLHRIREVFARTKTEKFSGPVEVDETYMGGRFKNMHGDKRAQRRKEPNLGKSIVAGAKDRATNAVSAKVIPQADQKNLHGFIDDNAKPEAQVFTDEAKAYNDLSRKHETVNHSAGNYVKEDTDVHTNGIESFWSMLKRAHKGTFHKMSPKHLQRYVSQFAGKHNVRALDTIDQMAGMVADMAGKRLRYDDLIADNGLESGARS